MAESFDDVDYQRGFADFASGPAIGTIEVTSDGVIFEDARGSQFFIPKRDIRRTGYKGTVQSKRYGGFALAGPNPVALAASLGLSVVGNAVGNKLIKPKTISNMFYSIHYLPENSQQLQEVVFKVKDQDTCKSLMESIQTMQSQVTPELPVDKTEPETSEQSILQ
ncbi:MAG: hypothetical protein VKJ04_11845 [Vampirovibrionales bacterium]|nr:hypothetical protein [Vampirovibrionales bacterium]